MKTIITAALIAVTGATALAQESRTFNKPVLCADRDSIIRELSGARYKEMPIWLGLEKSTGDRYSLFVNGDTGSWTLIQFDEKIACVIGAGERSQNITFGPAA
jgi:hypothetical protein